MSALERLRFHVQSLIARGLAAAPVAQEVGLAGASEIWGGVEPRDKPGWYLWLRGYPGVYALDLDEAEAIEGLPGSPCVGRMSVRHYPSPHQPEFGSFSPEERAIVAGGWLDSTGAPGILRASSIPQASFVVGTIDLVIDEHGATSLAALGVMDRLRCTVEETGERARDVPAWALALPLFSTMAGLVAQVERRSATRLVAARQRGFELVHRAGAFTPVDTDAVSHHEVLLLFGGAGCRESPALLNRIRDPDAQVWCDLDLGSGVDQVAPSSSGGAAPQEWVLPLPVPPAWFARGAAAPERLACCS